MHYLRLPASPRHPPAAQTPPQAQDQDRESPKKQIIFIASLASYLEVPPIADYNAAKFGVRGLFKSLRRQARRAGVRTNLIAPTFLPTAQVAQVVRELEARGARVGRVADAVDAVVRVACDDEVQGGCFSEGG